MSLPPGFDRDGLTTSGPRFVLLNDAIVHEPPEVVPSGDLKQIVAGSP
jgi:hypothetical protein